MASVYLKVRVGWCDAGIVFVKSKSTRCYLTRDASLETKGFDVFGNPLFTEIARTDTYYSGGFEALSSFNPPNRDAFKKIVSNTTVFTYSSVQLFPYAWQFGFSFNDDVTHKGGLLMVFKGGGIVTLGDIFRQKGGPLKSGE